MYCDFLRPPITWAIVELFFSSFSIFSFKLIRHATEAQVNEIANEHKLYFILWFVIDNEIGKGLRKWINYMNYVYWNGGSVHWKYILNIANDRQIQRIADKTCRVFLTSTSNLIKMFIIVAYTSIEYRE